MTGPCHRENDLPRLLVFDRDGPDVPTTVREVARRLDRIGLAYEISRNPPVVSCEGAARVRWRDGARGIPLGHELHSRVLSLRPRSRRQLAIVHFGADRALDEGVLRDELQVPSRPRGASGHELEALGFDRGTVNPFFHLACAGVVHLFDADTVKAAYAAAPGMMTNAGDPTWAVQFSLAAFVDGLSRLDGTRPVRVVAGLTTRRPQSNATGAPPAAAER